MPKSIPKTLVMVFAKPSLPLRHGTTSPKDGSKEIERIPAEIWRINENEVVKVFVKEKEVVNIVLDPNFELADVEMNNNVFPKKTTESRFDQFKKNN